VVSRQTDSGGADARSGARRRTRERVALASGACSPGRLRGRSADASQLLCWDCPGFSPVSVRAGGWPGRCRGARPGLAGFAVPGCQRAAPAPVLPMEAARGSAFRRGLSPGVVRPVKRLFQLSLAAACRRPLAGPAGLMDGAYRIVFLRKPPEPARTSAPGAASVPDLRGVGSGS